MKKFTQRFFGLAVILFLGLSLSAQAPFWTEDFDGGLPADWSAVMVAGDSTPNANWFWTMQGPAGGFAINPLQSTTSNNGWMIFDSDLNCSGEQNAWLVSPKIDLSDKDLVILTWQQYYRKFGDQINVQVSLDSTIWTQFPLLTGLENNDFGDGSATGETNPQTMNLDISSVAANEPQVWFAFQFLADSTTAGDVGPGCAYSWQIDDVGLLDFDPTPATDLSLGDFFFPPLSFATPTSQIATDTMGFSADVSNVGAADVTNVVLKATVTDENGNTLFVDSVVADVIPVGTIDSTLIVPNLYPPASDVGIYTIRYDLYSLDSEDQDMGNNSATEDYIVTEDLWSKENGPTIAYRPGDGPVDYLVGNMYTTSPNWVETYYATNVDFTAATNNSDGPLSDFHTSILLLEVKEDVVAPDFSNFDDQKDYLSNPGLKIRAFELYQYQGNNFDMQTVLLNDFDEEKPGVELKPGN
ncbi:MAG TPA: hypothetical protein ENJ20_01260, partial [Bacteroidetes bacterium]|nr:hypothetical protein [Bacteroidota bacterium]